MIGYIIKKVIGSKNDREVKRVRPMVVKINEFEAALQSLPDEALRQKTAEWKTRLSAITDNQELAKALTEVLPEAFAVVKNACRRLVGTEIVVRGHYYGIVDEVDSILIDEARTPLIISGPSIVASDSNEYDKYKPIVESLVHTQEKLCNRFLSEAADLIKKLHPEDGSNPSNPEV